MRTQGGTEASLIVKKGCHPFNIRQYDGHQSASGTTTAFVKKDGPGRWSGNGQGARVLETGKAWPTHADKGQARGYKSTEKARAELGWNPDFLFRFGAMQGAGRRRTSDVGR